MRKTKTGFYEHYSGKKYRVIAAARHSETLEPIVIYQGEYNSQKFGKKPVWARPQKMFEGTVTLKGKKVKRFKWLQNQKK